MSLTNSNQSERFIMNVQYELTWGVKMNSNRKKMILYNFKILIKNYLQKPWHHQLYWENIVVPELPAREFLFRRLEEGPSIAWVNRRLEWHLGGDLASGKSNRIFASNVQVVLMRLLLNEFFIYIINSR